MTSAYDRWKTTPPDEWEHGPYCKVCGVMLRQPGDRPGARRCTCDDEREPDTDERKR
jgi:hypothetical protein